jgi:acyl carrier protein
MLREFAPPACAGYNPFMAEHVRSEIVQELSDITGLEATSLTPEATLQELDIDSLDMVEFKQIVEDRYDVVLERDDFTGVVTIGNALDVILPRIAAGRLAA